MGLEPAIAKQVEKTRSGFKQEARFRRLATVFLKGNNIVLIGPVTPLPMPASPDKLILDSVNEQSLASAGS